MGRQLCLPGFDQAQRIVHVDNVQRAELPEWREGTTADEHECVHANNSVLRLWVPVRTC